MIRLSFAAVATLSLLATPALAIVGDATPGNGTIASHVVAIVGEHGGVCSGTAIGRDLVLTAAHCLTAGERYEVLELATATRRPQRVKVAGFEQHPGFKFDAANAAQPTADVAVVKLAKPLSAKTVPIALGERDFFPAGDHFLIAGFGSVGELNDGTFGRLLSADLAATSRQYDLQLRLVDPQTRGLAPGMSACSGDSGGPVFEATSTGLVLVGVISWAATSAGTIGCGGVTGATPFPLVRTWIKDAAKKLGSPLIASVPAPQRQARPAARTQSALRR